MTIEQLYWKYYTHMAIAAAECPTSGNLEKARKAYEAWREEVLK